MDDRQALAAIVARGKVDLGNDMTLAGPENARLAISEVASSKGPTVKNTVQKQASAEEREASSRAEFWKRMCNKIGSRYSKCEFEKWQFHGTADERDRQAKAVQQVQRYFDNLPEHFKAGEGLLLHGPPGTGKDFLMAALMRKAVLTRGLQVDWCNGVEMFGSIRDAMDTETTERTVLQQWVTPPILAISDPIPPWGNLTEFQASMLFRIIDRRYRLQRPTWVTLNVENRTESEDRMGIQVVSRLGDGAALVRCEWQDFRRRAR